MNSVLVVGGGGREHAICVALAKSPKVDKLYCLPGNAGIAEIAECAPVSATDLEGVLAFVKSHPDIGMTVVAPDDPLAMGMVDMLEENGFRAFGPRKNAAIIEASKAFSKKLMKKYGIPTADYREFDDHAEACEYVKTAKYPLVVKADGLALGKGVVICNTVEEALAALEEMMVDKKFKSAGNVVVIEEFLTGKEVSVLAFTDGKTIVPMVSSQDHKRAHDNDEGANTGGMGTFSPSKAYTPDIAKETEEKIILPTMRAMNAEGRTFKGVLYFGLMLTAEGVKVLEYNARFGDPETQVVLPRLKSDLYEIFDAVIDERLEDIRIEWDDEAAVCVIMASGGYPGSYRKGVPIEIGALDPDITIYHAGTARDAEGRLVTSGGRVLGVTAKGKDIDEARAKAYANVGRIKFDGAFWRTDIGIKK